MRDFINELSNLLDYEYRDLIEVDLLLCRILFELSQNSSFSKKFLFKGGTCLIKHYLGYYRFSEDLDFTLNEQDTTLSKTKHRSKVISEVGGILEEISKNNNLEFINDKSNRKYFAFTGNNFITFRLFYNSEILNVEKALKIEININEYKIFKPKEGELKSIVPKSKELQFLFPDEYVKYSKEIVFPMYDIREILCEKVRAILTRREIKGRDFIDIFYILNKYHFKIEDFKIQIINKVLHSFKSDMFINNFKDKLELIESEDLFEWKDEERLLLKKINEKKFELFLKNFYVSLKEITKEIYEKIAP